MNFPRILLLLLFIGIGCTALFASESEFKTDTSPLDPICFFKRNPPIKYYQRTGLLYYYQTLENTSNSKIQVLLYAHMKGKWVHLKTDVLGPKDKTTKDYSKYSILGFTGLAKFRVLGYSNALYCRFEDNELMSTWFDRDE